VQLSSNGSPGVSPAVGSTLDSIYHQQEIAETAEDPETAYAANEDVASLADHVLHLVDLGYYDADTAPGDPTVQGQLQQVADANADAVTATFGLLDTGDPVPPSPVDTSEIPPDYWDTASDTEDASESPDPDSDPDSNSSSNGDTSDSSGDDSPVVLDLAGKGIKITQLTSSNTYFDMTGDGYKNLTAWAGAGNGVLFFDPTGTGQLTQANQINFTDWDPGATTDMQALLDVFDTNHDGSLDAGDQCRRHGDGGIAHEPRHHLDQPQRQCGERRAARRFLDRRRDDL
jgi:hypothetical protein